MQSRSLHPTDAEHKGFGHSPTSILQRKWCLYRQTHCLQEQRIVYTSALLAGATKPLNVLSKIWKSFCNRDRLLSSSTWSGRLFFCSGGFCVCIHSKQGKLYQLAIFESDFTNPASKTLVGLRPNPIFSTKLRWMCILSSKGIMTHKGAGTLQPSLFLPKFSSPFLATRRKWRIFKSFCWHSSIFVVVYSNNLI